MGETGLSVLGAQVLGSLVPALDTLVLNKLNLLEMGLYVNDFTPDENTVLGDLTEATYNGYARQALTTWTSAVLIDNDYSESANGVLTFTVTSSGGSDEVYGVFVVEGSTLWSAARSPLAPVRMNVLDDTFIARPFQRMRAVNP